MKKLIYRVCLATVLSALVFLPTSAGSAAKVELSFLSWLDTGMLPKYVDFANEYMQKRYPDITVVGTTTVSSNENYNAKVQVSMAAGAGPDIYFFNLGNFDPAWIEKYNMMLDITNLLNADPAYKAEMPPALLEAWSYQGRLYGLPTTIGQYAIYYNRDHFAEKGLRRPADDWTIQGDYATALRKLAVYDSNQKLIRYGEQMQTSLKGRFYNFLMSNGGWVVDDAVTKARTTEPAFVEIVQLFKELLDANLITRGGTAAAYDKFVAGTASMLMSGIFYQSRVQENAKFDWGVAPFPAGKAGRLTVANTNAWVINPASKHIDLAWELVKCFSSAEFTVFALKEGLEFPVALSALHRYFFATLPPNLSRAEGEIWLEAVNYIRPFPKHPLTNDVFAVAENELTNVWTGKAGPLAAMTSAAERINRIIAQGAPKN